MFKVNIYIGTSLHGPKIKDGSYGYVIEYYKKYGGIVTREGFGNLAQTTEHQLTLVALKRALERLIKPCSVLVFIECEWIQRACENNWLQKWKDNDWKTAKNEPVKDIKLWKSIDLLMERHFIEFAPKEEPNTFKNWLDEEIRYWMEENAIKTE